MLGPHVFPPVPQPKTCGPCYRYAIRWRKMNKYMIAATPRITNVADQQPASQGAARER
jgi:hypothetical protein